MYSYGLGKTRTKLGQWCDKNKISQNKLIDMTGINKNTITSMCNDLSYEPYEITVLKMVSGLRRHGYDVVISDFW